MKKELSGNPTTAISLNSTLFQGCLGTLDGACIEKLLLHCARALENNDVTLAQQVMWVLNNVASPNGDPNQRLASWLLSALLSRASRLCSTTIPSPGLSTSRKMSVTELADYVDLTPWHRFGFSASNGAILNAVKGKARIHIIDFSITHCMQWPTLIDTLAKRPEGAPVLRISVASARPPVPPFLRVSIEEVGLHLAKFAKLREVPFEFNVIKCGNGTEKPLSFHQELASTQFDYVSLGIRDDEAVVVNCQNWLRFLPDEPLVSDLSMVNSNLHPSTDRNTRDGFLEMIRKLNPCIVTVTDEDADLDSPSLTSRIMSCFNYLWIPFDALETFLPKNSRQRMEYEADVGIKIESIVGSDGARRLERQESGMRLVQRMRRAGFLAMPFDEETMSEVKFLLGEHSSGWGMKREEEEVVVLTWKGHSSVFTTTWVPSGLEE